MTNEIKHETLREVKDNDIARGLKIVKSSPRLVEISSEDGHYREPVKRDSPSWANAYHLDHIPEENVRKSVPLGEKMDVDSAGQALQTYEYSWIYPVTYFKIQKDSLEALK